MSITLGRHSYCTNPIEMWDTLTEVGNFTSIASPCSFMGPCNHPSIQFRDLVSNYPFNDVPYGESRGINYPKSGGGQRKITINNDVWIGYDCIIRAGVTIGDGAIVGMKSVVTKDIPSYAVAVGNPLTIIKFRFSKDIINKLLKIKWWEWDDEVIIQRIEDFKNVNNFVMKYA